MTSNYDDSHPRPYMVSRNSTGYFHEVYSTDTGALSRGLNYDMSLQTKTALEWSVCIIIIPIQFLLRGMPLWSDKAQLLGTSEVCFADKLDVYWCVICYSQSLAPSSLAG